MSTNYTLFVYDKQNWEEYDVENWGKDGYRIRSDTQKIHTPISQITSIIPAARVLAVIPNFIIFDLDKYHPCCYLYGKVMCDKMFYYAGVECGSTIMQEVIEFQS
jgi:hypothetical protein